MNPGIIMGVSSPARAPLAGQWFLWLMSLGFGAFVTLFVMVFSLDDPRGSRFFIEHGFSCGLVLMGAVAVVGLLMLIRGKLHIAVLLNLGQIVAIPLLLWLVGLVLR